MPVEGAGAQLSAIKDRSDAETLNSLFANRFRRGGHDGAAHTGVGSKFASSPRQWAAHGSRGRVVCAEIVREPFADTLWCQAVVAEVVVVCATGSRSVLAGPLLDRPHGGPGNGQTEGSVGGLQGVHRVGLQVGESDVGEPIVTDTFAKIHRPPNALGPTIELLRAEFLGVVAGAAPAAYILDQTAHRPHHLGRITVAPHEFGARVRLNERVEGEHVHRRLEVPQYR